MLDFGFYNMDCMEGMKQFPDKYFELAIVDPPYGDAGGGYMEERIEIRREIRQVQDPDTLRVDSARDKVARTGGTWAAKFGKKLYRGTWPRDRTISTNCFASHRTR